MVKSRFSSTVYICLFFVLASFVGGIYLLSPPEMAFRDKAGGTDSAAIPGFALFFLSVIFFLVYGRGIFILKIHADRLVIFTRFSTSTLPRADISRIQLMGRGREFNATADGLTIETSTGRSFFLRDYYCRNMPKCKGALLEGYKEFIMDAPQQATTVRPPAGDSDEEFRGNFWSSMNGIVLTGVTLFFLYLGIISYRNDFNIFSLIFLIPMFAFTLAFGGQLFYFRITWDSLEIRNHVFWWYSKEYPLSGIAQAVIESATKRSTALHLRTVDFRSRNFSAGSLRDRHWVALAAGLKERGIAVRNEVAIEGLPLTRDEEV